MGDRSLGKITWLQYLNQFKQSCCYKKRNLWLKYNNNKIKGNNNDDVDYDDYCVDDLASFTT